MNSKINLETICQQIEAYGRTTANLYKYTVISKSADILSSFFVYVVILVVVLFSLLFSSMAVAYWIGDYFGKVHVGFIIVSLLFVLALLLLYKLRNRLLKIPIQNALIRLLQKE